MGGLSKGQTKPKEGKDKYEGFHIDNSFLTDQKKEKVVLQVNPSERGRSHGEKTEPAGRKSRPRGMRT